jgi:hypothetical protein
MHIDPTNQNDWNARELVISALMRYFGIYSGSLGKQLIVGMIYAVL